MDSTVFTVALGAGRGALGCALLFIWCVVCASLVCSLCSLCSVQLLLLWFVIGVQPLLCAASASLVCNWCWRQPAGFASVFYHFVTFRSFGLCIETISGILVHF